MFDGQHIRQIRRSLGLTQLEFSQKYKIPIGSLCNWEQERNAPDATAVTLLYLISEAPDVVAEMLKNRPPIK